MRIAASVIAREPYRRRAASGTSPAPGATLLACSAEPWGGAGNMDGLGTFGYVIVGGGRAGCVMGGGIGEGSVAGVCLIEAGPDESAQPQIIDFRNWAGMIGSEPDWTYEIESQE